MSRPNQSSTGWSTRVFPPEEDARESWEEIGRISMSNRISPPQAFQPVHDVVRHAAKKRARKREASGKHPTKKKRPPRAGKARPQRNANVDDPRIYRGRLPRISEHFQVDIDALPTPDRDGYMSHRCGGTQVWDSSRATSDLLAWLTSQTKNDRQQETLMMALHGSDYRIDATEDWIEQRIREFEKSSSKVLSCQFAKTARWRFGSFSKDAKHYGRSSDRDWSRSTPKLAKENRQGNPTEPTEWTTPDDAVGT